MLLNEEKIWEIDDGFKNYINNQNLYKGINEKTIPTDSKNRKDIIALRNGKLDEAFSYKHEIENEQRHWKRLREKHK